jgi:uncharacterized repeat protein (TIGR02543 family)
VDLSTKVPTRAGYDFVGWYANSIGYGNPVETFTMTKDRTVYAKWEEATPQKTLTLVYDPLWQYIGGDNPDVKMTFDTGTVVDLTTLVVPGHETDKGITWYADSGLDKIITSVTMGANRTIYAGATLGGDTNTTDPTLAGNGTNDDIDDIGSNNGDADSTSTTHTSSNHGTTNSKVIVSDTTTDQSGAVTQVDAVILPSVQEGDTVTLPTEVTAAETTDLAPVVNISVASGSGDRITVKIPVKEVTPGTVAVIVNADGTEEIAKKAAITEDGLSLDIQGDTTLKIIDNTKTFADTEETQWAEDAITFVAARGIFHGTSETTFSPAAAMTRGMLAQVIYNLENSPASLSPSGFLDVSETAWCADAISWAAENYIVTGYGDGTFGPNDSITREQLAAILWRYAGQPTPTQTSLTFHDVDQVSGYAREALLWANEQGIINGKGDGILDPKGLATRAEVAQMIMNFISAL